MRVVITDANIFIDLEFSGLLELFFELSLEISTTKFVLEELSDASASVISSKATIIKFSTEDLSASQSLKAFKGFSFTDKSLLYIAHKYHFTVFSGEKKMRKWCTERNIEFHGILYIFELFIQEGLRTTSQMAFCLEKLLAENEWLPEKLCIEKIEEWRET